MPVTELDDDVVTLTDEDSEGLPESVTLAVELPLAETDTDVDADGLTVPHEVLDADSVPETLDVDECEAVRHADDDMETLTVGDVDDVALTHAVVDAE